MRSLAILCALAGAAHADGAYITENIGPVRPGDQASDLPSGVQAEVHLGVRMGYWALELQFIADNFEPYPGSPETATMFAVGLGARYVQPITRHFSLYLRGRASRGWGGDALAGYAGNGLGAGAGIQLVGHITLGKIPIAGGLFVDAGEDFYRLHGVMGDSIDTTLPVLSLGWALGTDF